jgi:Zn-dependent metalloprotease
MLKNKIVALCMLMVILNVVLFSAVQAQKPPDNRHLEMIPEEQEDYYRFEHKRVSKESGTPLALYNVNYAVYPDTPEKMARQYLQDNARLLMINTDLSDLAHTSTRETPGGFHVRFQQHIEGYSVYQGDIVVNLDRNHTVTFVMNSYKPRARLDKPAAPISLAHGEQVAKQYLNVQGKMIFEKKETVVYYNRGVTRLAHKITMVPAEDVFGDWEVLVDAHSGEIFRVQDKALYGGSRSGSAATGAGRVFDPDPLTRAGALYQAGGQFGDNNDQDTDSLVAQIVDRDLLDIDFDGSQYHLKGPYAQIVDIEAPFNGLFSRSDSLWQFTRNPDDFEA